MRISRRIAILLVIFSAHAGAKAKKTSAAPTPAASMDSNDPASTETDSDEGPYGPKGEVGDHGAADVKRAQAQQPAAPPAVTPQPRAKIAVFGNVLIGFGKAPEAGPSGSEASGTTTSVTFMVGGHYDLSPEFALILRLPWTVGSARQPDGLDAATAAFGSAELLGEYRESLSPRTLLPIDFGFGIPIAQGGYDTINERGAYQQTQLNGVADAASGFRDPELFAPKRLPIIFGVGIEYQREALELHAASKFVAGFKVGGEVNAPATAEGSYELKSVTFRNVTSAGVGYQFWDKPKLFGGFDSWIAYSAVNAVEFNSNSGVSGPTRIQVVFEPHVSGRFGKLTPSVGYVFPIGGRLADNSTSGLDLHCDVAF
jgi:hypothetical protein